MNLEKRSMHINRSMHEGGKNNKFKFKNFKIQVE